MHALREGQILSREPRLPLPARVRKLVQQRLERLSERGRRLVAVAAVIGRQFDFALVQRAAQMSEREAAEGVEELVRHRILRGAGDGLEFSHDHIREVATSELPPPLSVALHRRVAESLEDYLKRDALGTYGNDLAPHALALGTHYRNGKSWGKAAEFLHMAGRQAAARSAHREAVACFEEALGALRRLAPEPRGRRARPRRQDRATAEPVPAGALRRSDPPPAQGRADRREARRPSAARAGGRLRQQSRLDHRRSAERAGLGRACPRPGSGRVERRAHGGGELPTRPGPLESGPAPGGGGLLRAVCDRGGAS